MPLSRWQVLAVHPTPTLLPRLLKSSEAEDAQLLTGGLKTCLLDRLKQAGLRFATVNQQAGTELAGSGGLGVQ